jgi:hypothetical protein
MNIKSGIMKIGSGTMNIKSGIMKIGSGIMNIMDMYPEYLHD